MIFMKQYFLTILFLTSTIATFAQTRHKAVEQLPNFDKQPVHWGYYLGFNEYDFKFNYQEIPEGQGDVLVKTSVGFNVGLVGNLRLSDHFDLRLEPGLYYTKRVFDYSNQGLVGDDALRETNSSYVHIPLLLKASAVRWGNVKPYIVGGFSTAINLGSKSKSVDDNSTGTFRMKSTAQFYELGIGIDFYLPTFKFSPSIRGVFGLTDEMVKDNDPNSAWTGNINYIKTRGVFINFTFE